MDCAMEQVKVHWLDSLRVDPLDHQLGRLLDRWSVLMTFQLDLMLD